MFAISMAEPPIIPNPASGNPLKQCGYCGKENSEEALTCDGCGTPFPLVNSSSSEVPSEAETNVPPLPSKLSARSATILLVIAIAVQVGVSVVLIMITTIATLVAHPPNLNSDVRTKYERSVEKVLPIVTFAAMAGTGVALLIFSRGNIAPSLKDRSPVGAAWVLGSPSYILAGAGLGILVAFAFFALATIPALRPTHFTPGPLTRMTMTPGLGRVVWLATALLLAPPIEELLFRGVLYGGYCRSFGPSRAVFLTTLIFCALHITEIITFPLAGVAIAAMATAALWMRLRSSAIGPAIAVHFSYNGVIALAQILAWTLNS
jgi:membrane protease YdiL (CAAX protease family)